MDNQILETKVLNTFHENGQLAYTETIAVLNPEFAHKFPNRRELTKDHIWIRTGRCAKYYDNGQLHWELNYDELGNVIKQAKSVRYRKDGTIIQYK